jgi:hypothetical protein
MFSLPDSQLYEVRMKHHIAASLIFLCVLFLGLLSCGGEQRKASDESAFAEADLRNPAPGGPVEASTAVLRGKGQDVYIQKANSKVRFDLDISGRGAFYMKVCGTATEQGEQGAVKFDVIAGENTEKPYTIYGGYLIPVTTLEDVAKFVNITVDISKYAGQRIDLTMRLVGEKEATLAWTQPEFRPFPGQGETGK